MAHDFLGKLLYVNALEIALFLFYEVCRAVKGNASVVAYDASASVGIGQSSDDVCVACRLYVIVVGREHTFIVCLAVFCKDGLGGRVKLVAV